MIVTVEEARTKWCPMVQFVAHPQRDLLYDNREGEDPEPPNCIADQCMAWKWTHGFPATDEEKKDGTKRGYCGLASP